jgi:hypothetical protein
MRSRADDWPVACFDVFVDGSAQGLDGFVPDGAARLVPSFTLRTGWLMPSGRVVEERVGSIIAYILSARLERYDRAGRQGAYDFQLLVGDEAAALEVTTCVDADLIQLDQALTRQGDEIPAPMLSRRWELWIDAKACPRPVPKSYAALKRRVEEHAPGLLSALEAQEVTYFERPGYGRVPPEIEALVGLGIEFGGCRSEQVAGGQIQLLPPGGGGGAIGPAAIVSAALAAADDNREKLERAGTTERHLAVWIDGSAFLTWMGFDSGPPTERPELDGEITTLWCVGRSRQDGAYIIWRYTPPGPWKELLVTDEDLSER